MILIYACIIITVVTCESTQDKRYSPNVGTVLFSASDAQKKQWTKSEIALLQARKHFQNLLPPPVFINTFNEDHIKILLNYFKEAYTAIKKEAKDPETDAIMTTALSDAIGGYFKVWILPVAKLDYYGGTISQPNVIKLFQFYNEIKRYLNTDGEGWHRPEDKTLNSITINVAPLQLLSNTRSMKNPCDNLAYFEKTPTGLGIPIPNVNWNDKLSTLFVPLKNISLISMNTPNSSHNLVKYYDAARSCIQASNPTEQEHFDERFQKWLVDDVVPHLKDENLYLALGSVLTLVNRTRDICNNVLDLYVNKCVDKCKCHKCKSHKKTISMPCEISSKKMWILIAILLIEIAWCVPALLFVLCSKKLQQRDCSSNVYLFIDNEKKDKGGGKKISDKGNCPVCLENVPGDLKIIRKSMFNTGQCPSTQLTNTMEAGTVPCINQCVSEQQSDCACPIESKSPELCYISKRSSIKKTPKLPLQRCEMTQVISQSSHETCESKPSDKSCLTVKSKHCFPPASKNRKKRDNDECRLCEDRTNTDDYCKKPNECRKSEDSGKPGCRQSEEFRKIEECKKLEERRQLEECRKLEKQRQVEQCRKLEEQKRAEECRRLEERRRAEECRKLEERRRAEECRKLEERRRAEECKKLEECRKMEERKRADECRKLEEQRRTDECRKLEEQRQNDECRKLEEQRRADECRKLEEQRRTEECRKLEERKRAEECRKLEEQRQIEKCKKLQEQRQLEECRKLEEQRQVEQCRKLEEQNRAEECKKLEEQRQVEQCRKLEEQKRAEECMKLQEQRQVEECRKLQERKQAEECRKLQEQRHADKSGVANEFWKHRQCCQLKECCQVNECCQVEECKKLEEQRKAEECRKYEECRQMEECKKLIERRQDEECQELQDRMKLEECKTCSKPELCKNIAECRESLVFQKHNECKEVDECREVGDPRPLKGYADSYECFKIAESREYGESAAFDENNRNVGHAVDSCVLSCVNYKNSELGKEKADVCKECTGCDEATWYQQVYSQEARQRICPCTACIAKKSNNEPSTSMTCCNISVTDSKYVPGKEIERKSTHYYMKKEYRTKGRTFTKNSSAKPYLEITIDRPGTEICVDMTQCRTHYANRPSRIPKPATCSIQPYMTGRQSTCSSPEKHKSLIPQPKKKTADDMELGSCQYSKSFETKLNGSF